MSGKKKIRVDLRKNRTKPPRDKTWTRGFQEHSFADEAPRFDERVRAKGDLSRRRTITQQDDAETPMPGIDSTVAISGRVLRIYGLHSIVEAANGTLYRCAVRRLLKSLVTDERSVVATGDNVWLRPSSVSGSTASEPEGLIEGVEPRHGVLTRESRGREHVLVANVDQIVIVVSLAQPDLKPHLIDRYVANARLGDLKPIICLNKVDLVSAELLQPMVGAYSQLGIPTLLTSASNGEGIEALREHLRDRTSVFSGQSGVGKSSLLNAIQPGLELAVRTVSEATQKGMHTTTTAQLLRLQNGGWVVDTPGIRQFKLWNVRSEEVEGLFAEFAPFVAGCNFPDCTHTHENACMVQKALRRRMIGARRFTSYLGMTDAEGDS
jgi:ribosome biogenesis GTPase